ncbi:hypothetical protein MNBD_GAMMA10-1946 [hydrothermal vent metagenome]|uniref:Haem-binding uptake Tiki superfamily ChaN domain-containing protein n=1 Tax=hydrothermal vent metagenome TaxID=652676 RepID=A0A3B0Y071_9ZZZZ
MMDRKPVDYSVFVLPTTTVVIFGEVTHNTSVFKDEFITALKALKAQNFTHVGMEMFPSDLNEKLKGYTTKGEHENALNQHLQTYWDHVPLARQYIEIIKAAKKLNMKIIGLDMPYKNHDSHVCKAKIRENCKTSSHAARNTHMTEQIIKHINQGAKIATFMQYWHARTRSAIEPGIKILLQKKAYHRFLSAW